MPNYVVLLCNVRKIDVYLKKREKNNREFDCGLFGPKSICCSDDLYVTQTLSPKSCSCFGNKVVTAKFLCGSLMREGDLM